ncbi:MAG: response regulator [Minisyncoccia bacterium]
MENIKGKKIMIVEDDKFFISLISKKLLDNGLEVLSANDGQQTFKVLETKKPDLIILDIMLPDIDGFEILKRLKEMPIVKDIPVIFLTNLGTKEDIVKGRSLGVSSFLIKATVTMDEVIQEISRTLGGKKI